MNRKNLLLLTLLLTQTTPVWGMESEEKVGRNQAFAIVTYNLAMGIKEDEKRAEHLTTKPKALDSFATNFIKNCFKPNPTATWFICVQEICNDSNGVNQVEQLQEMLKKRTGYKWYKHSNTQPESITKEAVAIFSNKKLKTPKQWYHNNRVALAVESEDNIWVVTAHPIKPQKDLNGSLRKAMLHNINEEMSKFGKVPQVLCGDFNIYDSTDGSFSTKVERDTDVFSKKIFDETVGYLLTKGFQRGKDFTPSPHDATFHSWNNTKNNSGSWGILDYIFVRNMEGKDITNPEVLNFKDGKKYISDHKGLIMKISDSFSEPDF